MTNFERVTASPEALAACLETIVCADSPWDAAFRRHFCDGCGLVDCDEGQGCPHQAERNNPAWWLGLDDGKRTAHVRCSGKVVCVDVRPDIQPVRVRCELAYQSKDGDDTAEQPRKEPGRRIERTRIALLLGTAVLSTIALVLSLTALLR